MALAQGLQSYWLRVAQGLTQLPQGFWVNLDGSLSIESIILLKSLQCLANVELALPGQQC
jgi:hypothetical protein